MICEQVGLVVIPVHFRPRDQIRQHGAEGDHGIDSLVPQDPDALLARRCRLGQRGHDQYFQRRRRPGRTTSPPAQKPPVQQTETSPANSPATPGQTTPYASRAPPQWPASPRPNPRKLKTNGSGKRTLARLRVPAQRNQSRPFPVCPSATYLRSCRARNPCSSKYSRTMVSLTAAMS